MRRGQLERFNISSHPIGQSANELLASRPRGRAGEQARSCRWGEGNGG